MFRKSISIFVAITFVFSLVTPIPKAQAQNLLGLPAPGTIVLLSPAYQPAIIKGLTVHKDNPFLFDFIVDTGQDHLQGQALKNEGEKLIKYFLASLAIPEKDLWVNLSPYEKARIIPQALGQTDMGRDLLAQDYMLKQITASLIYPEKNLGKEFWDKVYAAAQAKFGTTQIPVNTFNKVWIMADKAEVYEHNQTVFVVSCHLKVILEEDYLALNKHNVILSKHSVILSEAKDLNRLKDSSATPQNDTHAIASQIVKQIILPQLEREVNRGKNFANLRQICNSLILASWYKKRLKDALLNQVYSNQEKVRGIDLQDKTIKEQIYHRYLEAYKKGVFNYIKEEPSDLSLRGGGADEAISNRTTIPRKYFSGGFVSKFDSAMTITTDPSKLNTLILWAQRLVIIMATLVPHQEHEKLPPRSLLYDGGVVHPNKPNSDIIVVPSEIRNAAMVVVKGNVVIKIKEADPKYSLRKMREVDHEYSLREMYDVLFFLGKIVDQKMQNSPRAGEGETSFTFDVQPPAEKKERYKEIIDSITKKLPKGKGFTLPSTEGQWQWEINRKNIILLKFWIYTRISEIRKESIMERGVLFSSIRPDRVLIRQSLYSPQEVLQTLRQMRDNEPPALRDVYRAMREESGQSLDDYNGWLDQSIKSISEGLSLSNAAMNVQVRFSKPVAVVLDDAVSEIAIEKKKLEEKGFLVFAFNSGEDALKALEEHTVKVDVFVCDFGLGDGMNGREFFERIKAIKRFKKTKFILRTGLIEHVLAGSGGEARGLQEELLPRNGGQYDGLIGKLDHRALGDLIDKLFPSLRQPSDSAMILQKGGIDLNTNKTIWTDRGEGPGVQMKIDPAMIERVRREGIDSLSPEIYSITPVVSIGALIGIDK